MNYSKMIQKIKNDLNSLVIFDIKYSYKNGLGFICSSPFFNNLYIIIAIFENGYQIRIYRNGLLDVVKPEREYHRYNLIKDILKVINDEIEYELK